MLIRYLKVCVLLTVFALAALAQPSKIKVLIRASEARPPSGSKAVGQSTAPIVGSFTGIRLECKGNLRVFISQADLQTLAQAFGAQVVVNSAENKVGLSLGNRKASEKSLLTLSPQKDMDSFSPDVGQVFVKGQPYFDLESSLRNLLLVGYAATEQPAGQMIYVMQAKPTR